MNNTEQIQSQLIELYEQQINYLVMMSKIGLDDDVIAEIGRLKDLLEVNDWDATLNDGLEDEDFSNWNESKELEIDRDKLYTLYMHWVDKVTEECDWVTSFGPKEIVGAIVSILENNPQLVNKK